MMHTVWHREHNKQAESVAARNPTWTDEEVFQRAKAITIAKYQHIVYTQVQLAGRQSLCARRVQCWVLLLVEPWAPFLPNRVRPPANLGLSTNSCVSYAPLSSGLLSHNTLCWQLHAGHAAQPSCPVTCSTVLQVVLAVGTAHITRVLPAHLLLAWFLPAVHSS